MESIGTVKRLYNAYKRIYKETGRKEAPEVLLALQLLDHKDDFSDTTSHTVAEFYNEYQDSIDKYIKKVEDDFHFTKAEYVKIISETDGYNPNKFENKKIGSCYGAAISTLYWGITKHSTYSSEWMFIHGRTLSVLAEDPLMDKNFIFVKTYDSLKRFMKSENYFADAGTYLYEPTSVTITSVELDSLKKYGNLTITKGVAAPIEIKVEDQKVNKKTK